jgi:hypothetical protein
VLGLLVTAAAAGALLLPAAASAAVTPLALDVPNNGAAPLVAYDPVSKVTFVAWQDPQTTANGAVDLCVLPANATACSGGGPVELIVTPSENPDIGGSNTLNLAGLNVLPNGDVVVSTTPVEGGTITFESPGDGSAFLSSGQGLENTGSYVSPVNPYYNDNDVVALSNSDIGILDAEGGKFSDSAVAGPESPALSASNVNPPPSGGSRTVYPGHPLGTDGPNIAAEPAPTPAAAGTDIVVSAGDNFAGPNQQLSDCTDGDDTGTGDGVDVGLVNGTSNASGTLNYINPSDSASIPAFSALACNAENPVLASPEGGTQGIGVLENEGAGLDGVADGAYTLDYRNFIVNSGATGGAFNTTPSQIAKLTGAAGELDVSDDTADGVYVSYTANGNNYVDYSPDGGANWGVPVAVPQPTTGAGIGDAVITGVGDGYFQLAFQNNPSGEGTQTFLETLSYQQLEIAPTTLTTTQASGSTTGANISIPAGTVGETDQATLAGTNAAVATGSVTYQLYDNSTCSGSPVVPASTASVTDGRPGPSQGVSVGLAPGTYYWQATYSGDTSNDASKSTCGSEALKVTAPSSTSGTGSVTGGSTVTVTISCASACTVTVTIETTSGGAADIASAGHKSKKPKIVKLGTGKLTLKKGGKGKLKIKLDKSGKSLFKKHHGKLKTTAVLATKTAHGTFTSSAVLELAGRPDTGAGE